MKVYTRLVIDISTSQILEEESFEYDGPLALCDGGGDGGGGEGADTSGEGIGIGSDAHGGTAGIGTGTGDIGGMAGSVGGSTGGEGTDSGAPGTGVSASDAIGSEAGQAALGGATAAGMGETAAMGTAALAGGSTAAEGAATASSVAGLGDLGDIGVATAPTPSFGFNSNIAKGVTTIGTAITGNPIAGLALGAIVGAIAGSEFGGLGSSLGGNTGNMGDDYGGADADSGGPGDLWNQGQTGTQGGSPKAPEPNPPVEGGTGEGSGPGTNPEDTQKNLLEERRRRNSVGWLDMLHAGDEEAPVATATAFAPGEAQAAYEKTTKLPSWLDTDEEKEKFYGGLFSTYGI